jgi:hypothetical protein
VSLRPFTLDGSLGPSRLRGRVCLGYNREATFYYDNGRGRRADSGCFECSRISDDKVCGPLMPQGAEVRFAFPNRQSRIRLCTLIAILG